MLQRLWSKTLNELSEYSLNSLNSSGILISKMLVVGIYKQGCVKLIVRQPVVNVKGLAIVELIFEKEFITIEIFGILKLITFNEEYKEKEVAI